MFLYKTLIIKKHKTKIIFIKHDLIFVINLLFFNCPKTKQNYNQQWLWRDKMFGWHFVKLNNQQTLRTDTCAMPVDLVYYLLFTLDKVKRVELCYESCLRKMKIPEMKVPWNNYQSSQREITTRFDGGRQNLTSEEILLSYDRKSLQRGREQGGKRES